MKNKASGFYADSLEMLLDTLCNVLGSIVFITLVLAVLVRSDTSDASRRRQTAALTNELAEVASSNAWVVAEAQRALELLQQPRAVWRTNQMHLPNQISTDKRPWSVIAQYGRLFSVYDLAPARGAPLRENRQSLEWRPHQGGATEVIARAGQGEDPQAAVRRLAQAFYASGRTNYYFAFLVKDDSFPAFSQAKEAAEVLGFQCGWEPFTEREPILLSPRGQRIFPQN